MSMQMTLAANAARLLSKANVVGVGIGYKLSKGRKTAKLGLTVLVEQKLPLTAMGQTDIIPTVINSYRTDVVASGTIQALSERQNLRVAAPGMSIGHYRISAGASHKAACFY